MADRKITALTELTAPVATDVFPIIDVSESANANKNKKIQLTTILKGIPNGSVSAPSVGFIDDTGTTGLFRVTDDEIGISCNQTQIASFATTGLKLGTGTAAAQLHLFSTDTTDQVIIENTDAGADTAPDLVLFRNSASPADNDNLANLVFRGQDDNGDAVEYATIAAQIADASNGSEDGILDLMSTAAGTLASRIRLKSEFVGIHESDPTFPLHLSTADTTAGFCIESNLNSSGSSADILLFHRRGDSGAGQDNDVLSTITFQGKNDGANETDTVPAGVEYAAIEAVIVDASDDTEDGKLNLEVMVAGTLTSVLAIDSNGATIVGSIVVSGTVDGVDLAARDTLFGGLTSSSGVLTNGVTATTQSASDNSTKVATTAYTDTAIANLVNSAPSTLDTLGEIATALNNDAALNTTLTNSIATKLPIAGGRLTGNVTHNDNVKAIFGTSGDLEIVHDSSHSNIKNITGNFSILSDTILLKNAANSESFIRCQNNGVQLYHSNSLKLETYSGGFNLTGKLNVSGDIDIPDDSQLLIGDSDDLKIYHQSSNNTSYVQNTTDNDLSIINLGTNIYIKSADGAKRANFIKDGSVELYFSGTKMLQTQSWGTHVFGSLVANGDVKVNLTSGRLRIGVNDEFTIRHNATNLIAENTVGNLHIRPKTGEEGIKLIPDGAVELYFNNVKKVETSADGLDFPDNSKLQLGDSQDLQLYHDSNNSVIDSNTGDFYILTAGAFLFNTNNKAAIKCVADGAVELYFNGIKRFNTTADAVDVHGHLNLGANTDDKRLRFGINNDLQLYHDGQNSNIDNSTNTLKIKSDRIRLNDFTNDHQMVHAVADGAVELYFDNVQKLRTTNSGITVSGSVTTEDMNMSNLNGTANEVDNTKGSWSIQEGADDLFIINRVSGKKYKFNLTEIS